MRIGIFGDVVGRAGRAAVADQLPLLRRDLGLEFVVINAENAAGGFGITRATAEELFAAGADVLTLGNHAFDQVEALTYLDREPRIVRPCNYPLEALVPGRGAGLYEAPRGRRVLVVQVLGRVFMDALDDPFVAVRRELAAAPLREVADAIVLDVHAESSSEKQAMGVVCDGRVSAVIGTHTHVPTADTRILAGGTAYQTDLGMTGDYMSVIGMKAEEPVRRFTTRLRSGKFETADGPGTLCGLYVETDDATGLAIRAEPIRVGAVLSQAVPQSSVQAA